MGGESMFLEFPLEPFKNWVQVAASVASILALAAAALWFLRTSKAKQRIQFDLDCKISPLAHNSDKKVAEIQFCFENKGFVEHRIYNLSVSVHSLESEGGLNTRQRAGERLFRPRILARTHPPPPAGNYYFIRPGIRQVVTHIVPLDAG